MNWALTFVRVTEILRLWAGIGTRNFAPIIQSNLPPEERSEFRGLPCVDSLAGFPSGRPRNKSGGRCSSIRTPAPVILTISDRFAATSSIKEEEGV